MAKTNRRGLNAGGLNLRVHRVTGLVAALFLVFLGVTGIAINHGDALGLDGAMVQQRWLLALYAEPEAITVRGYRAGDTRIAWANGQLFFGRHRVANDVVEPPIGAVRAGPGVVVALPGSVLIFTPDGRLVERMEAVVTSESIRRVGTRDGRVVLRTEAGCLQGDTGLLSWASVDCPGDAAWAQADALPPALRDAIATRAGLPDLPWSRLLLDLHSGRLFGPAGVYVVDLLGLGAVVLAVTGFVNWRRSAAGVRRRR